MTATTTSVGDVNAAPQVPGEGRPEGQDQNLTGAPASPTDHTSPVEGDSVPSASCVGTDATPTAQPLVIGLDLSLVATGVAVLTPSGMRTHRITVDGRGIIRLRRILAEFRKLTPDGVALVVVEGPSYGSVGAGSHERAGLWWLVQDRLWRHGIACAVVPPASLKKYAVGVGGGPRSSKDQVLLAAARRWPLFTGDNNEADAAWLAQMGLDHLTGVSPVPARHRAALAGCTWPTVPAAS